MGSSLLVGACDSTYRYLFFPPERVEYTLVPDMDLMQRLNDTSYSIGKDSLSIVYDRKTFKVEVKYLSDYQLNTTEYPEESKDEEFSANPFTYANWVDPQLGYTPSRFSVFKVSIFNYAAAKLNFDPENSFLATDRGDVLPGYGREEKSSRNQSIEGYYKKRKGSSGVDDEIFERRMGIVRTVVLYLGRPVYAGDSREGLVVYDPIDESVEKVKVVFKNFITGYDENNEPSEFVTLQFYFKRAALIKERFKRALAVADTSLEARAAVAAQRPVLEKNNFDVHLIRYEIPAEQSDASGMEWNSKPNALPNLLRFVKDSLRVNPQLKITPADSPELLNAPAAFVFVGPSEPIFSDVQIQSLSNMIKRGGFLFIENAAFSTKYTFSSLANQLLENIAAKLERPARVQTIPADHALFRSWQKITSLPEGMDDIENMPDRKNYLQGLFWKDRLVAIASSKGYSMIWDQWDTKRIPQFILGANILVYALKSNPNF